MKKINKSFENLMIYAIKEAKKAEKSNEIPVGCIIFNKKTKKIIAKSHNKTEKFQNPLCHAEIIAIQKACKKLGKVLDNCSIYVTLEPCLMCSYAIALAKIKNIYIGTLSEKTGTIISNFNIFNHKIFNYKSNIFFGIMEEECSKILKKFFKNKRY